MDDLQRNLPPQCNEEWFDRLLPFGKEFELPNISNWADTSDNMFISQYELLDTLPTLEGAFVFDMNDPSSAGNQSASFPVIEMVPSFSTSIPMVDQRVHVFSSSSNSSVDSFVNSSRFGSNFYFPRKIQSTHVPTPPNISLFCRNGSNASNSAFNHRSGCTSFIGSSGSLSLRNEQLRSSSFAYSPLSVPNGCLTMRNQSDLIPAMTTAPHISANESSIPNSSFLQNTGHITRIKSNISNPMRNEVENLTHTHWSNCSDSLRNQQAFVPSSLQVGQSSYLISGVNRDECYKCSKCGAQFPTFHALGGHMSAHSKARKREAQMICQFHPSCAGASLVPLVVGDGSGSGMSNSTSGVMNKKFEGLNSLNEAKDRLLSPSAEDIGQEDISSLEDIVKTCSSMLRKRSREDVFPSHEIMEKGLSPLHKVVKKESSSLDEIGKRGL